MSFRRYRVTDTCILILLVITSIGSLVIFRSYLKSIKLKNKVYHNEKLVISMPYRHVTKSLSELEVGVPELSDHVVFFNRVPKTGSEMLVLLLQWLQGANGFRHVRLGGGDKRRLSGGEQEGVLEEVTQIIRDEAVPVTFDRHVYFLNFTKFGRQSPMYINLVRDPIDKAISRFYYRRVTPDPRTVDMPSVPKRTTRHFESDTIERCLETGDPECRFNDGQPYDLSIPYFCGHEPWCMYLNDERALNQAKLNAERYFPVVGVLEELNATLAVLEKRIPYFFKGVQDIYYRELLEPHKNKNRKRPREISKNVRQYLTSRLITEFEFYNWIRARLLRQFNGAP